MSVIIQHKRGTESQWTTLNPTLAAGEVGWESDTNRFKIGTGSVAWNSLPYFDETVLNLLENSTDFVPTFIQATTPTTTASQYVWWDISNPDSLTLWIEDGV